MAIESVKNKASPSTKTSVLVTLRLQDRFGVPLDPYSAWFLIQEAFRNHPHVDIVQAEIHPNKEERTSIHETN